LKPPVNIRLSQDNTNNRRIIMKKITLTLAVLLSAITGGQQAMAGGSMQHASQASAHSVQASGHAALASAQLTSAAVAIPLQLVGAVGAVSGHAGDALMQQANDDFTKPLNVSDETVTAGPPPSEALLHSNQQQ